MNQILYSERAAGRTTKRLIIAIVVLLIIIFVAILFLTKQLDGKILANVYVGDIDVGIKSKEDAINIITPEISKYNGKTIQLILNENSINITPEDIGFGLESDINKIVDNAYSYGRGENFFNNTANVIKSYFKDTIITPIYKFDDDKLDSIFKTITSGDEVIASDDTYEISGDKIYIYKGSDGIKIDTELSKKYITTAFLNDVTTVYIPTIESDSKKINLENIYDEIYVAPKNASFNAGETFEVVIDMPGKYFDLSEAKKAYEDLLENNNLVIEIKNLEADIKVSDLEDELFSNVLATYSTLYDQTETDRVQNLKVATERCNNIILYPGDEFSYNKALGTRTIANGFAPGHSFAGGRVVTTIGGGICQVSSTLYNVVLMADLEVTNRVAHGMYVEYVKPSLDATVVDGSIDFKFKNDRKYPVKIEASAENGIVKVSILGIKDNNEPIVEIESVILETIEYTTIKENDSKMDKGTTEVVQEPVNGYKSEAYKIIKDKNGNELSRTLISKDRYIATNEIIKVGIKEEVVVPVQPEVIEPIPEETPKVEPGVIINQEEDRELPPGWDSPESPYSR